MASISLGQFQAKAQIDQKIGLDRQHADQLTTRPAQKSWQGRVAGWFSNLTKATQTNKTDTMVAFQGALKGKYGDAIGTAAFNATFPEGVRAKSLTSRQVNDAIANAESQREANTLQNVGKAKKYGPGGVSFGQTLAAAGVRDQDLPAKGKDHIQKNLLHAVQQLSYDKRTPDMKRVDVATIQSIAVNLTKTEQLSAPYLPPSGTEFGRIARSLGVEVGTLDHEKLAAEIRDGIYDNHTSVGSKVARTSDMALEVTAALVKGGIADAMSAAETDPSLKTELDNIRDNTPAGHPKHFRDIVRSHINVRIQNELATSGQLGPDGIAGITKAVIRDVSANIDAAKAATGRVLEGLTAAPPDTTKLMNGLVDLSTSINRLVAGGDDTPTSFKIAFDHAFGELGQTEKTRLLDAMAQGDALGKFADEIAAGVNHVVADLGDAGENQKAGTANMTRLMVSYLLTYVGEAGANSGRADAQANVEDLALRLNSFDLEPKDNAVARALTAKLG